jgi:hypothetical protein
VPQWRSGARIQRLATGHDRVRDSLRRRAQAAKITVHAGEQVSPHGPEGQRRRKPAKSDPYHKRHGAPPAMPPNTLPASKLPSPKQLAWLMVKQSAALGPAMSYSSQFVTLCHCFGMRCRRSRLALNGKQRAPGWSQGVASSHFIPGRPPARSVHHDGTERLNLDEENRAPSGRDLHGHLETPRRSVGQPWLAIGKA